MGRNYWVPPLKLCCVAFSQQFMLLGALSWVVSFLYLLPITQAAKPNPLECAPGTRLSLQPEYEKPVAPILSQLLYVPAFGSSDKLKDKPVASTPCPCGNRSRAFRTGLNEHMDSGLLVLLHSRQPQTNNLWVLWVKNLDRAQKEDLSLLHWYPVRSEEDLNGWRLKSPGTCWPEYLIHGHPL